MFRREHVIIDPDLGILTRSRGAWRGVIGLDAFGPIPLVVPGPRSSPDPQAVALARSAPVDFRRCRTEIEASLADHRDAYESGPAADVAAVPCHVAVIRLDRRLVLEFGYRVPWDEEHLLGARVLDGTLIELNGSVQEP